MTGPVFHSVQVVRSECCGSFSAEKDSRDPQLCAAVQQKLDDFVGQVNRETEELLGRSTGTCALIVALYILFFPVAIWLHLRAIKSEKENQTQGLAAVNRAVAAHKEALEPYYVPVQNGENFYTLINGKVRVELKPKDQKELAKAVAPAEEKSGGLLGAINKTVLAKGSGVVEGALRIAGQDEAANSVKKVTKTAKDASDLVDSVTGNKKGAKQKKETTKKAGAKKTAKVAAKKKAEPKKKAEKDKKEKKDKKKEDEEEKEEKEEEENEDEEKEEQEDNNEEEDQGDDDGGDNDGGDDDNNDDNGDDGNGGGDD